jgi:hypothetical protein
MNQSVAIVTGASRASVVRLQFAWRAISLRLYRRTRLGNAAGTASKIEAEDAEPAALALDLREPASAGPAVKATLDRYATLVGNAPLTEHYQRGSKNGALGLANTVDSLGFGTGWCGEPLDEAQRRIALDPDHVVFEDCVSQTLCHTGSLIDA